MATGIGIIVLLGLLVGALFTRWRLPGLLGMLLTGVAIGPHALGWLHPDLMAVSADLRRLAFMVILLRAGLGLNRKSLMQVGPTALLMSTVPATIEGFAIAWLSMRLFGLSFIQGGMLGFIIAAVSLAVVVPQMLRIVDKRLGEKSNIPTMLLASAGMDSILVVTLFGIFLSFYGGGDVSLGARLVSVPISIALGLGLGWLAATGMMHLQDRLKISDAKLVLTLLGTAIMLNALESALEGTVPIASLLGVMAMGFMIREKRPELAARLADQFGSVWVLAEMLLFVLVGAEVNVTVALGAGLKGLAVIAGGLVARSVGVFIATATSGFSPRQRLFCTAAFLPKATVQAAIGGIPLAAGVASGELILAIAVMAILVTAPLGSILIDLLAPRLLDEPDENISGVHALEAAAE